MEKNIKILHVYKTSLPQTVGGIEVFIDTLCSTTARHGIKNTVLSLAETPSPDPIQMSGYTVHQARQNLFIASTGFSVSAFFTFRKLVAEADIVHYHFPNPFADILHFSCRVKKPTIVTYHSDIIKQKHLLKLYKPLMNQFLKSVNCIVATSPNYLSTSNTLQKFRGKTSIIPIGLDKESYPALNKDRLHYWKSILPEKFFLFVGALRYYKGLHFALEAIAGTNCHLVLAGVGDMEEKLKNQAVRLGLENIQFLGDVSDEDKVTLLRLCYAFIFPSHLRSEAFGISLLEAAMYGKPLISSEIGSGMSFINIDQTTGFVVKPSSGNALKKAMESLLDNQGKANEFGRNAEKRYCQHFTADKQSKSYASVYRKLLDEHHI